MLGHFLCSWVQVGGTLTKHSSNEEAWGCLPTVDSFDAPCPSVLLPLSSEEIAYYYYFYKRIPSVEKIKYAWIFK